MNIKNNIKNIISLMKKEKKIPVVEIRNQNQLLEGEIALITGGTGDIGKEIAKAFLNAGAKVILVGRNEEKLVHVKKELPFTDRVRIIPFDLLSINNYSQLMAEAEKAFDEKRIDILVNAAGIMGTTRFLSITEKEFDSVFNTNLKATVFLSQEVSNLMIRKGIKGHILNISSASALRPAATPYQLSKWGINGLTKGMADCLIPYGIVVNAIGPGPTASTMLGVNKEDGVDNNYSPSKRFIMPTEIANVAVMLVSGAGDMVVGDTFYITGGSGTLTLHH